MQQNKLIHQHTEFYAMNFLVKSTLSPIISLHSADDLLLVYSIMSSIIHYIIEIMLIATSVFYSEINTTTRYNGKTVDIKMISV